MGHSYTSDELEEMHRKKVERDKKYLQAQKEFRKYLKSKDREILISGYKKLIESGKSYELSSLLIKPRGNESTKSPHERSKLEYEVKINFTLNEDTKGLRLDAYDLRHSIRNHDFLPSLISGFIGTEIQFYGKGDEEYLAIMKSHEYQLKWKTHSDIEVPWPVIVREEKVVRLDPRTSEEERYSAIEKAVLKGNQRQGWIDRGRTRMDLLSSETGNTYEVVFDECEVHKADSPEGFVKRQAEVEYQESVFKENSSESIMIPELIKVGKLVRRHLLKQNEVLDAEFTTERKYDWLVKEC